MTLEEVTLILTIAFHSRQHSRRHSRRLGMHAWWSGMSVVVRLFPTVRNAFPTVGNAVVNAVLNEKQWSGLK